MFRAPCTHRQEVKNVRIVQPYYMIYVPNFATKCCHLFALCAIKVIDILELSFNKAIFTNTVGSKETKHGRKI